jgi:hypothetical protein
MRSIAASSVTASATASASESYASK